MIAEIEFILYVKDQQKSTGFYSEILGLKPSLNVPGMTEFKLSGNCKLGLMPESGITKIICPAAPDPSRGSGIPRCELYLKVDDIEKRMASALNAGATLIDHISERNWGDTAGYIADLDGHIIAFAKTTMH
ncbi:MAG: lactoylglutathione lyase [Bacteroidetes bacterium]|nr:lactoylglutathione lyase [Bacteroidota bacterium]